MKVGTVAASAIAATPLTRNGRRPGHPPRRQEAQVAVGSGGVGGRGAELAEHRRERQREGQPRRDPGGDVEERVVGAVAGAEPHQRRGHRHEAQVDGGGHQLGDARGPDPRLGVEVVAEVAHGLEALDGDHDAAEHQERVGERGVGHGWEAERAVAQRAGVVQRQGHPEHGGEQQRRDQADPVEPVEARETAHGADPDDQRHSGARQHPLGGRVRLAGEVADDVLRHDPQVERHRDDVGDHDHGVGDPLEPTRERVELPARRPAAPRRGRCGAPRCRRTRPSGTRPRRRSARRGRSCARAPAR